MKLMKDEKCNLKILQIKKNLKSSNTNIPRILKAKLLRL